MEDDAKARFPKDMESVVASVSGYHGTERFMLIKMISQSGANYVGTMNRFTTHLVCWKFEGRKYDLAKHFNILVVNHRWVEECIKQGKCVPEQPYLLQSGHEVGPFQLEMPLVTEVVSQLNAHKNKRGPIIDIEHGMEGHLVGARSRLLSESLYPEFGASNDTSWLNKKTKNKSSRHGCSSSRCYEEPLVSTLFGVEDEVPSSTSSTLSGRREKRSTNSTEPHCKGRRLVKKNIRDFFPSDSEQAEDPIRVRQHQDDLTVPSRHSDAMRDKKRSRNRGASDEGLYDSGGNINECLEDDKVVEDLNGVCTFRDPNLHHEDAPAITERTFQVSCSNINDSLKGREHVFRLPTSTDLSCVICWTDFSSTRGVLPCGHRFCFSCIQSWADVMASMGKISTCPLCKSSFVSITRVDGCASLDQKTYSQTIPHEPSGMDIFILQNTETLSFGSQSSPLSACTKCCCREPDDLLVRCHLCQIRCIHSYCMDPPLLPWTCIHCKDLQMLYRRIC